MQKVKVLVAAHLTDEEAIGVAANWVRKDLPEDRVVVSVSLGQKSRQSQFFREAEVVVG